MKNDPPEIYGWRIFAIACTACFGGMLFGMDTGTIGGVLVIPAFEKQFGLQGLSPQATANLSANIVSVHQAGCFAGALVAWPVADRIGRRIALLIASGIAIVGITMQAASAGNLAVMYIGRLEAYPPQH